MNVNPDPNHRHRFEKVLDARKHPIRHLWRRNGRFYARLTVEDPRIGRKAVRRVPLEGIQTVAQAQAKLRELLVNRQDAKLPVLGQTPRFSDYADGYLEYYAKVKDGKRPSTMKSEREHIRRWQRYLCETRLDKITTNQIEGFIAQRQEAGWCGRTVNLAVTVLKNVLKRAIFTDKFLKALPTAGIQRLKWKSRRRDLVTSEDLGRICDKALVESKNGQQVSDYIRLMAFCGSRMTETLNIRWQDIDWERRQLTIGWDGQTKNREARVVDFNPKLETHLKEMLARRAPDSIWLFPSPQRGETDRRAKTFTESMRLARKAADVPHFSFHSCRHHFISMCVMSNVDYLTISKWAGHKDGGILVGKTYGHLTDEHAQRQAAKVDFH